MRESLGRIANARTALLAGIFALSASCAPRAVAIHGKAADAILRGIESGKGSFDHGSFDAVLKANVREAGSRFDYRGLKERPEDLNRYLKAVAEADLASLSRNELLALLLNAYNAYTLQSVVETFTADHPDGVASIRDISGVFTRKTHAVGSYLLSLDDLEHGLIRPLFKDPRIHFVVNCASVSCAPLPPEALTGERLESQLEEAARRALSSPAYLRVEGSSLLVTKLLDWYGVDFMVPGYHGAEKDLPHYLRKYASPEVVRFLDGAGEVPRIEFMDYDWSLNRAASSSPRP